MGLRDYTIYDFIRRNARLYPDQETIVFKEIRLSHGEFESRCHRVAAGLAKADISMRNRLRIVSYNCEVIK